MKFPPQTPSSSPPRTFWKSKATANFNTKSISNVWWRLRETQEKSLFCRLCHPPTGSWAGLLCRGQPKTATRQVGATLMA